MTSDSVFEDGVETPPTEAEEVDRPGSNPDPPEAAMPGAVEGDPRETGQNLNSELVHTARLCLLSRLC